MMQHSDMSPFPVQCISFTIYWTIDIEGGGYRNRVEEHWRGPIVTKDLVECHFIAEFQLTNIKSKVEFLSLSQDVTIVSLHPVEFVLSNGESCWLPIN